MDKRDLFAFVDEIQRNVDDSSYDVVVKPSHLSCSTGVIILSKKRWENDGWSTATLLYHIDDFWTRKLSVPRAKHCSPLFLVSSYSHVIDRASILVLLSRPVSSLFGAKHIMEFGGGDRMDADNIELLGSYGVQPCQDVLIDMISGLH